MSFWCCWPALSPAWFQMNFLKAAENELVGWMRFERKRLLLVFGANLWEAIELALVQPPFYDFAFPFPRMLGWGSIAVGSDWVGHGLSL